MLCKDCIGVGKSGYFVPTRAILICFAIFGFILTGVTLATYFGKPNRITTSNCAPLVCPNYMAWADSCKWNHTTSLPTETTLTSTSTSTINYSSSTTATSGNLLSSTSKNEF
jgi:hypothetical protein